MSPDKMPEKSVTTRRRLLAKEECSSLTQDRPPMAILISARPSVKDFVMNFVMFVSHFVAQCKPPNGGAGGVIVVAHQMLCRRS
jgi:hypothetical protein